MASHKLHPFTLLAIGGSAGSLDPLRRVLSALPPKKEFAVVCVLHLLSRQKSLLPKIFGEDSPWAVKEAESTEPVQPGTVYLAPPDYHLSIEADRTFALSNEEAVMFSRPSIDLFFESAARVYKNQMAGLILSGANDDGTRGLLRVLKQGGLGYVQDPETADFKEMPGAALKSSNQNTCVTIERFVDFLNGRP